MLSLRHIPSMNFGLDIDPVSPGLRSPDVSGSLRTVVAMILALSIPATVGASTGSEGFHTYSGDGYGELVSTAFKELPNLNPPGQPGSITGSSSVDSRIWVAAFTRGYQMTPLSATSALVSQDGHLMQPLAAEAWERLQAAAAAAGHRIVITSAHRSVSDQKAFFEFGLSGTSDTSIESQLAIAAPPGASRHHTGYTLDIKERGSTTVKFKASKAFAWLSKNNYYNAKQFGFVPSYPPDGAGQGPDPEAWEYIFVGIELLAGDLEVVDVPDSHFAAGSVGWMYDKDHTRGCREYFFCPDDVATRGEVAVFMKRVLESYLGPTGARDFFDTQGHQFEAAIGWLAGHGITLGCDPPAFSKFCPNRSITRGEMSALFKRAVDHLILVDAEDIDRGRFVDTQVSVFINSAAWLAATGITQGCNPPANDRFCPNQKVTRAELAVFLRRIVARL